MEATTFKDGNHKADGAYKLLAQLKSWQALNVGWILFSIPFIAFVLWQSLEQNVYQRGVQTGTQRASDVIYSNIIAKAANEDCKSIYVEHAGRRVDLVNVRCLRAAAGSEPAAPAAAPAATPAAENPGQ